MKKIAIVVSIFILVLNTNNVFALPMSQDDLWDVNESYLNISSITTSGMHSWAGDQRNMFGGAFGSGEVGNTLFTDSYGVGHTHSIEWELYAPETIRSFNLVAAHDSDITRRGFMRFELEAWVGGAYTSVYEWDITNDVASGAVTTYGGGENYIGFNILELYSDIGPVTSSKFRASFDQAGPSSSAAGPRILELDGYATSAAVPEPASMFLFGLGAIGAFFRKRFV